MGTGVVGRGARLKTGQKIRHLCLLALWLWHGWGLGGGRGGPELNLDEMEASWDAWAKTPQRCPPHDTHRSWGGARPGVVVALNWVLPVCRARRARRLFFPLLCHLKANLYLAPPPGPGDSAERNAGAYSEYLGDDFPGPSPCLWESAEHMCWSFCPVQRAATEWDPTSYSKSVQFPPLYYHFIRQKPCQQTFYTSCLFFKPL